MWMHIVGGIVLIGLLAVAFILGRKSYVRKIKTLGSLHILVDEIDGSRYPLVELNNDHDLWELKPGDVAMFMIKHVDKK